MRDNPFKIQEKSDMLVLEKILKILENLFKFYLLTKFIKKSNFYRFFFKYKISCMLVPGKNPKK